MSTEPDPSEHETDAGAHEDAAEYQRPRDTGEAARDGAIEVADAGRFAGFTLGDGDCIIYDTENQCAWIQSSAYVDVESVV